MFETARGHGKVTEVCRKVLEKFYDGGSKALFLELPENVNESTSNYADVFRKLTKDKVVLNRDENLIWVGTNVVAFHAADKTLSGPKPDSIERFISQDLKCTCGVGENIGISPLHKEGCALKVYLK